MKGSIGERNEKLVISQLGFLKRSRRSLFTSIPGSFVTDNNNAAQEYAGQVYNIETRKINEEPRKRERYKKNEVKK